MTPQIWQSQKGLQDGLQSPATDLRPCFILFGFSSSKLRLYAVLQTPQSCHSEAHEWILISLELQFMR